jgi:hypothetical protein
MSNIQQIIETAKKQHSRGELTIHELQAVYDKWGVCIIVDGDEIGKSII